MCPSTQNALEEHTGEAQNPKPQTLLQVVSPAPSILEFPDKTHQLMALMGKQGGERVSIKAEWNPQWSHPKSPPSTTQHGCFLSDSTG